jgi:mRNA-degrading endonuclease RelE of RelBE toxin-antitoxin system
VAGGRVLLKESVIDDLRVLGTKPSRAVLREATKRLEADPLAQTRNMKTLRPNLIAQRELRLFGKYRALFNIGRSHQRVTIVLVGEKRGDALIVQGRTVYGAS